MKDNRIFKNELLTKESSKDLAGGADLFFKKRREKEEENTRKREEHKKNMLKSGAWIEKNGRIYDARYVK